MRLYASEFCPFCHSVRLALEAKEIKHEIISVDLTKKTEMSMVLSPYGRVPVLEHDSTKVFESAVINEYIEDVVSETPLLPNTASTRAQVRFWVDFVHRKVVPKYFDLMNCADPGNYRTKGVGLTRWLRFADQQAFDGEFFVGDRMSLADVALFPWIERFVSATRYRGVIIPTDCKSLHRWIDIMSELRCVQACAKPQAEYIEFFDQYWAPLDGIQANASQTA